jgi:alkanesulfonate monooxygenase SsuD/methylene tetrahydromethanopterin reductase-like flavin-dependent oxidoreductase (luciferase family)
LAQDAFQVCSQWAIATEDMVEGGIRTGILVVPVGMWSPAVLAATAGSLGELTGNRFALGIGSGNLEALARLGLAAHPPIAMMREYLITLRGLFAGERVTFRGQVVRLDGIALGFHPPAVPLYLAALGPQMLRVAGALADGAALNWCTPEQVAWSRERVREGAERAGRNPADVRVVEYIRICVDEDPDVARRALARALIPYALAHSGAAIVTGYRAHFNHMGFEEILSELVALRGRGVPDADLIDRVPTEVLSRVGYFGRSEGAAAAFQRLAQGLDLAIVRVVAARPGRASIEAVMHACRPELTVA